MEIAVLSDIHSNYEAFKKCVEYSLDRGIETFVFLGDYLGELPYPQKTMQFLFFLKEKYTCYFIKGNKEDYWMNYKKNGETGWKEIDSTTGALFYTYYHLTAEDMAFFETLSHKAELCFENLPLLTICHGSPNRTNEKLLPDDERTFSIMECERNCHIICGHTHIQGIIEHNGKKVFNAGAVGVPLNSGGKAQFMILSGTKGVWSHEFISLDYDVEKVISELHASGLSERAPHWCKVTEHLLRTGNGSHGAVLARAMVLCSEQEGSCHWPDVPEQYWAKAVEEMIG
ncbi:MAG: metallophosphoesterase family protein [Lachnospiraceae bacterium]|nr:metallophosphoesterase family protein [Lachnospiraceae bacterium]